MKEKKMNGLTRKEIDKIYPVLLDTLNKAGRFGEKFDTKKPLSLKIGWSVLFQDSFEIRHSGKDCYDLTLIF